MRINQIKNTPNFKGLYNNKFLLSSLEKISNHGASFSAGVAFLSATILRPLAISLTPKADKENKKFLSADSIASGVMKLLIALGISIPIEKAVKNIKNNPQNFLKNSTIKNLSKDNFDFLAQSIKLSSNLISAIPKSILGVSLIPIVADLLTKQKQEVKNNSEKLSFEKYKKQTSFKGNLAQKLAINIFESKNAQNFAIKHSKNSGNIAKNISALTDVMLTTSGIVATCASKKIKKDKKKPLIINKFLSSAISLSVGYTFDEIIKKMGSSFVEKFKMANINDKNLSKYLSGLDILRPTIIFALLYYGIIPFFTTYVSDKLSNKNNSN